MWGSHDQHLEQRWMAVSTNEKCKIGSKGVMWGHVTNIWNFVNNAVIKLEP